VTPPLVENVMGMENDRLFPNQMDLFCLFTTRHMIDLTSLAKAPKKTMKYLSKPAMPTNLASVLVHHPIHVAEFVIWKIWGQELVQSIIDY
jgi:hypothetical protein